MATTKLTAKRARVYSELAGVGSYPGSPSWSTADVWPVHDLSVLGDPEILECDLDAPEGAGYGTVQGAYRPKWSGKSYCYEVEVPDSDDTTRPAHHRALRAAGFIEAYNNADGNTLWYALKAYTDQCDALSIRRYLRNLAATKVKYRQLLGGRCNLELAAEAGKLIELNMVDGMGVTYSQGDATESIPALAYPTLAKYIFQGATVHFITHKSSSPLAYSGFIPKLTLRTNRNIALHMDGASAGATGEATGDLEKTSAELEIELLDQLIQDWDAEDVMARGETVRVFVRIPGPRTTTRTFGFFGFFQIKAIGDPQERDSANYRNLTLKGVWPDTGAVVDQDPTTASESPWNYDAAATPASMLYLFHHNPTVTP